MKESSWRIPITDLKAQYHAINEEVDTAMQQVLRNGQFILGPEVKAFEEEMAAYCGTQFAVGLASGTDALKLALLACDIGTGDEVVTTPFSFVATAETIVQCGARPVFVDINPFTYNLDASKIESKINSRTRAILPVHLYGQAADMDPIMHLARKYNLRVIEDCAQALGAEYKGSRVGSFGDAGCLSFFPSKGLGAYGDGGMVVTSDAAIAERVDLLRRHGAKSGYGYVMSGFNSRLDTVQAAILLVKLKQLDTWINLRHEKAAIYNEIFRGTDGIEPYFAEEYGKPSFNYYTIRIKGRGPQRDRLRSHLESKGIQTQVYYPLSLHLEEAFRSLGYSGGDFPVSEQAQEQVLSLPMYPELPDEQVREVAGVIREFIKSRPREPVSY